MLKKSQARLAQICYLCQEKGTDHKQLSEYDEVTCSTTEALCYIDFDDNSWSQAKLPVRYGGLGNRTAADLALPAFLSSRPTFHSFVNDILCQPANTTEDDDEFRQKNWDDA